MEYEYAKNLAIYLWETHYKTDTPEWEPCEDLMGVLTQIDNMITGLTRKAGGNSGTAGTGGVRGCPKRI